MRIGISLQSAHAVRDVREGARWMIERARAAEEAGLDSLFVGDHHATPAPYYQNSPMLGRLLAEWGERPAGALYLLPLWHPLLLAEQIGTLAALARGRFIVQCAIGADDAQLAAFGVGGHERVSRFEESLGILRRLLAGETVSSQGHWSLRDARVRPLPPEPVEVWIGALARAAIERAARLGEGWLASPSLGAEAAARQIDLYRAACERHGRRPTAIAIRRDVYVGSSAEDARAVREASAARGYRGFPPDAPVCGDPEQVAKAFADLRGLGYTDVIVRSLAQEQSRALASIERLAAVRHLLGE
jgi:alkanesulfonate monooxygenase SsuD/methylene tetrahydromethanopterin reductase-like flavin-dependent oxidoreductase (luciferase family)